MRIIFLAVTAKRMNILSTMDRDAQNPYWLSGRTFFFLPAFIETLEEDFCQDLPAIVRSLISTMVTAILYMFVILL